MSKPTVTYKQFDVVVDIILLFWFSALALELKVNRKWPSVGAARHKLLRQVFGVLKSQKPFDPNFLSLPC